MLRDADFKHFASVYIVCGFTDLRYGIDSLAAIIEQKYHMSLFVPNTLSQEDFLKYKEELAVDISKLTFCEEAVAVDIESDTIFISQSSGNLISKSKLLGSFGIDDSNYSLFILEDAALNDIAESVRDGMPLTLVITDGMQAKRVSVIITTLPVLKIDGDWAYSEYRHPAQVKELQTNGETYVG